MFVAGKHNEHEDMKWKIIFLMTGGLLFVQASVAQKSVTDTVQVGNGYRASDIQYR